VATNKRPGLVRLEDSGLALAHLGDDIRGLHVYDRVGDEIGKIRALLVDEARSKVRLVDVESGGVLGVGAEHRLIPVEAIESVDGRGVHVGHTRDSVRDAPGYDPELATREAYEEIYAYYGYPPYWGLPAAMPMRRLRD
jgi:hypothetical protein